MKPIIAVLITLLSLIVNSVTFDVFAQSEPKHQFHSKAISDLVDSLYKDGDIIFDRTCCPIICNEFERPDDCIPRYSDASMCGECNNIRTGEVGIYTQDLNEPQPDTTLADAFGRMIKHNNRINSEISKITSKLTALNTLMKPLEKKVMLRSAKLTTNEWKKYDAALRDKDTYEADLAKLLQLQSAIHKMSSNLFLLNLSNQFKKVD